MLIRGMGMIAAPGLGVAAWEAALRGGWRPPAEIADPGAPGGQRPAYLVDFESVSDKTLLKKLRRADKLSKMAVLAAADAAADSGLDEQARGRVGIILATALGPHVTTFEFLDGLLDYGDAAASPTAFSHSVHNAAASYIASSLGIQGPTLTVTRFSFAFQEALRLARCWLDQGRCDHVLVGTAEQYGDVLGYIAAEKLAVALDGRIRPFTFGGPGLVPGEGSVFFLLGREGAERAYCRVESISTGEDAAGGWTPDLTVLEADGMLPDESGYLAALAPDMPVAGYAPLVGSLMTGSAFAFAAGALMLQRQMLYAAPVQETPHPLNIVGTTRPAPLKTIRSIGCNCHGELAVAYLTAP